MAADEYDEELWTYALGHSPARDFNSHVFTCKPAMVQKKPVNGHRMWTEYDPEKFSEAEWDIVPGMWDHEHCCVCKDDIREGDTYWQNSQKRTLCSSCHETFQKKG